MATFEEVRIIKIEAYLRGPQGIPGPTGPQGPPGDISSHTTDDLAEGEINKYQDEGLIIAIAAGMAAAL